MTQPRVAMSAEELSCEWIPLQAGIWPRGPLQWHGHLGGLPHVRDVRRDPPVREPSTPGNGRAVIRDVVSNARELHVDATMRLAL